MYLPWHVLEEIYQKSVLPTVTYGILVWGTCSPSLLDDLEHYPLRAAKMIYNIEQRNLTNKQILPKVNWKSIVNIYKRRILSFMHDIYYMNVPKDLQNLFERNERIGRRKQSFNIVKCKIEKERTSLRYRGLIAWDQLHKDIQKISNKTKFRIKVNDYVNLEEINFLKEASVNNNKDAKDFIYF